MRPQYRTRRGDERPYRLVTRLAPQPTSGTRSNAHSSPRTAPGGEARRIGVSPRLPVKPATASACHNITISTPSGSAISSFVAALQAPSPESSWRADGERALVAYADVLTMTPAGVTRAHIDALLTAGYSDRAIHDACAIITYFAFVNRIADGLGVQLERTTS